MHPISENYHMSIQSLVANVRFKISPNLSVAAGPSISHIYSGNDKYVYKPEYSFVNYRIDRKNQLVVSARAALSVNF
jgi:hypothetical protein